MTKILLINFSPDKLTIMRVVFDTARNKHHNRQQTDN